MNQADQIVWIPQPKRSPDVHVAFRGTINVTEETTVEIRALASSWFILYLDDEFLMEGPLRFIPEHPEFDYWRKTLKPGKHVLAAHVHDEGVATRMLPDMPPFLYCTAVSSDGELPIHWKCQRLEGHASQFRRINAQLGWVEWCDTRNNPADWKQIGFDDSKWIAPVPAQTNLGPIEEASIGPVRVIPHKLTALASGPCAEAFGYEPDDPATRFFLRDLECTEVPPSGAWRRYDLGRVRLGRPRFVLDLPVGALVEFAYAEQLRHGRVSPFITLSGSASCNLDHFIARGGKQEFFPLTPKGGRFLEVHILADPAKIKFIEEIYVERTYHREPEGSFKCDDDLLNRIWITGVETYRACSEDAIIDNPTRERGQWVGDALIGGEIAGVAYEDLRLMRRGLLQTGQCARADGLVPGMTTGGLIFIASYAALWITGCMRYYKLTGDRSLLEELFEGGKKNLAAFEPHVHPEGLTEGVADSFIDWGFDKGDNPINIPLNFHYLSALQSMSEWCKAVNKLDHVDHYTRRADQVRSALRKQIDARPLEKLGYHACAFALAQNFFDDKAAPACVAYLKKHMLNCFPNNKDAPRNSDPGFRSTQLITPYFAHFVMPALIEHGEIDFVLDQYRKCWGWALEGGRTTWVEVFDTRWSHCHQWAGSPTWQLSRYILGIKPRADLGQNHFDFHPFPGSLKSASGKIPTPAGSLHVTWTREKDGIHYELKSPGIVLHMPNGKTVQVNNTYKTVLS
jgi:alpha-L-rhamnosidase